MGDYHEHHLTGDTSDDYSDIESDDEDEEFPGIDDDDQYWAAYPVVPQIIDTDQWDMDDIFPPTPEDKSTPQSE